MIISFVPLGNMGFHSIRMKSLHAKKKRNKSNKSQPFAEMPKLIPLLKVADRM